MEGFLLLRLQCRIPEVSAAQSVHFCESAGSAGSAESGRERKATRENSAGSNVEVESMEDTEYVNYFLEGREAPHKLP